MKKNLLFLSVIFLALAFSSCQSDDNMISASISIDKELQLPDIKLGDLIEPTGFIEIKKGPSNAPLKGIDKVIMHENELYILDNSTDFTEVWKYDLYGNYLGSVGRQGGEEVESHGFIHDFTLNAGTITILAPERRAFYNYDLKDLSKSPQIIENGAIGDMVARDNDGNYFIYNEHSATDATGFNYVTVYNKSGEIINRFKPYSFKKENLAYSYTGFLRESEGKVLFSPPFSRTVYSVSAKEIKPEYTFDFGSMNPPANFEEEKVPSEIFNNIEYLDEWFVKNGNMIQVSYAAKHALYDTNTGIFVDLKKIGQDYWSKILNRGTIMPKDNDEFLVVLNPYFFPDSSLIEVDAINHIAPEMGDQILNSLQNGNYCIITFKYKPNVGLH